MVLTRKATHFTPDLVMKDDSLHFSGKLWMENPPEYFEEIFERTRKSKANHFSVRLDVEHLNSSCTKQLLMYFKLLREMNDAGKFKEINILWNIASDDEDMETSIQDLASICEVDIKIGK